MAFWCLPDSHCCNGGGEERRPITRSNYLLQPLSWQQLSRLLPKLYFTNNRIQRAPTHKGKVLHPQEAVSLPNTKTWVPEVNSVSFKATLFLNSSRPSNWMEERWWCQPLGMAPEDDTAGISTLALVPHYHTPGSRKASGRPVCACS